MRRVLSVFLCSTYTDLVAERNAVIDTATRLRIQHDSMELFGARPELPLETCLDAVRRSDLLIVIVGHRYGSIVEEFGISYAEAEYQEGYRLGKPCLVYLRDEDIPVLIRFTERNPENFRAFNRFKDLLRSRHTVALFQHAQDLAVRVAADLTRTIEAIEAAARLDPIPSGLPVEMGTLWQIAREYGLPQTEMITTIRRVIENLTGRPASGYAPVVSLHFGVSEADRVRAIVEGLDREGFFIICDSDAPDSSLEIDRIVQALECADAILIFPSQKSHSALWYGALSLARRVKKNAGPILIAVNIHRSDGRWVPPDFKVIDIWEKDTAHAVREISSAIRSYLELRFI